MVVVFEFANARILGFTDVSMIPKKIKIDLESTSKGRNKCPSEKKKKPNQYTHQPKYIEERNWRSNYTSTNRIYQANI
jgi:hypothetical protein